MKELPDDRIESIKKLLEKGKTLPDHYKALREKTYNDFKSELEARLEG